MHNFSDEEDNPDGADHIPAEAVPADPMLALKNHSAGGLDGIVTEDVESTIRNLGELGNRGMADTDQVILDMMVCR